MLGQNGSIASTIATSVTSGSAQSIAFSVTGMPNGMTADFTPSSVTAGSSVALVLTTKVLAAGTYTLTVIGSAGSLARTATLSVMVTSTTTTTQNDFTLAVNPANVTVAQGGSVTANITTAVASGSVASVVSFTIVNQQPGMTASLSNSSVTTGSSVVLTINGGTALAGTYPLVIIVQNASMVHTATVVVTVTGGTVPPFDFALSANPSSVSVGQNGSAVSTIATSVTSGSAQLIAFSVTGMPTGMTATFSSPSANAGSSVAVVVSTTTVVAATYPLTVTGTAGSLQRSTTVNVAVSGTTTSTTNGFTLTPNPASVQVAQGATATTTITTNIASGSVASIVNLTVVGMQPGMTASLSNSSVTTGSSVVLTINGGTALAGTYPLVIIAQNASVAHTATVVVTVTGTNTSGGSSNGASCTVNSQCISGICTNNVCTGKLNGAACDRSRECASETCSFNLCQSPGGNVSAFKLTVTPDTLNLQPGNPGAANVQVDNTVTNTDVQQVTLSASGVGGITVSFTPSVVKTGESAVVYVDVPVGTADGTYTLPITGTSGSLSVIATLVVKVGAVVASTDDFSFVANPTTFTLPPVGDGQSVAINVLGAASNVDLKYSGAPKEMIVIPSTYRSRGGGNFSVTIRRGQAVPGTYRILVTGTSTITHTIVLTAIVAADTGGGTGGTGGAVGTSCTDGSQCSFGSCKNNSCIDTVSGAALCALPSTTVPVGCWVQNVLVSTQSVEASTPYCCKADATALAVPAGTTGSCLGATTGDFKLSGNIKVCAR